jgi:hypothetical protein
MTMLMIKMEGDEKPVDSQRANLVQIHWSEFYSSCPGDLESLIETVHFPDF